MRKTILLITIIGLTAFSNAYAQPETPEQTRARIIAENQKIEKENADITRLFKAGNDALNSKNYAEAIARWLERLHCTLWMENEGLCTKTSCRLFRYLAKQIRKGVWEEE